MKWLGIMINNQWWLALETPTGEIIPIQYKGERGYCIRF